MGQHYICTALHLHSTTTSSRSKIVGNIIIAINWKTFLEEKMINYYNIFALTIKPWTTIYLIMRDYEARGSVERYSISGSVRPAVKVTPVKAHG